MFKSEARTDIGLVRTCNEDSLGENPELGLWLVADGVGGNGFGDFASQVVAQTVERQLRLGSTLEEAIKSAHSTVIKLGDEKSEVKGMASTVVAAHFKGSQFKICWVGDSRAYVIRCDAIEQLTTDHNQAQYLYEQGDISLDEVRTHPAQRLLLHAVGIDDASWAVDTVEGQLKPDEVLLLCSDGLSGELDDADILDIFVHGESLSDIADKLVHNALARGGSDNITLTLTALEDADSEDENQGVAAYSDAEYNTGASESDDALPAKNTETALKFTVIGILAALLLVLFAVWAA